MRLAGFVIVMLVVSGCSGSQELEARGPSGPSEADKAARATEKETILSDREEASEAAADAARASCLEQYDGIYVELMNIATTTARAGVTYDLLGWQIEMIGRLETDAASFAGLRSNWCETVVAPTLLAAGDALETAHAAWTDCISSDACDPMDVGPPIPTESGYLSLIKSLDDYEIALQTDPLDHLR